MSCLSSIKARLGFHSVLTVPKRQRQQLLALVPVPPLPPHPDLVVSSSVHARRSDYPLHRNSPLPPVLMKLLFPQTMRASASFYVFIFLCFPESRESLPLYYHKHQKLIIVLVVSGLSAPAFGAPATTAASTGFGFGSTTTGLLTSSVSHVKIRDDSSGRKPELSHVSELA